ncbi:MAG: site-specific integrase, partial [Elusimicrobia bacterium]|nr:site-specific integrase [Elusimicrobiota bacterium]
MPRNPPRRDGNRAATAEFRLAALPEPILTGFLKHLSLERGLSAHTCRSYGYDLK